MSMYTHIPCLCKRKLKILKPLFNRSEKGLKSHAHCQPCKLEWHLTFDGRVYSHPYVPGTLRRRPHTLASFDRRMRLQT